MLEPNIGKLFIGIGVLLILAGVIFLALPKIPFLGKLPGDIRIEGERSSFYFPIVTCIVISLLLTFLLNLFRGFK